MSPGPSPAEGVSHIAEAAKQQAANALGLNAKFFTAEPVMGQKLEALGLFDESVTAAVNPDINVRQTLLGMITTGNETFGVIRLSDKLGRDADQSMSVRTIVTVLPNASEGKDARARYVGEVPLAGKLPIGRAEQPELNLDSTVSRKAFSLYLDASGVVSLIEVASLHPTSVVKRDPKVPGDIESINWAIKSREAREILSPVDADTIPKLGRAAVGNIKLVPEPLPVSQPEPAAEEVAQEPIPVGVEVAKEVTAVDIILEARKNERLYARLSEYTTSLLQNSNISRDVAAARRLVGSLRASGAGSTEAILKQLHQTSFGLDRGTQDNPTVALRNVAYLVQDAASFIVQNAKQMEAMYELVDGPGIIEDAFLGAKYIVETAFRAAFNTVQLDPKAKAQLLASMKR